MSEEKFFCNHCGECCRHIDKVPELKKYDLGNGICKFLKGSLCSIYDQRPDICNVDKMYDKLFSKCMSREEYYLLNHQGCADLKAGVR